MEDFGLQALESPYEGGLNPETGEYIVEPQYYGMSNGEVIWQKMATLAAAGSLDHAKYIMDRTLGKPKQSIETTNLNVNYSQFLEQLAEEERMVDIAYIEEVEL